MIVRMGVWGPISQRRAQPHVGGRCTTRGRQEPSRSGGSILGRVGSDRRDWRMPGATAGLVVAATSGANGQGGGV